MKIPPDHETYAENKLEPVVSEHAPVALNKGPVSKKVEELPGLLESEAHFVYDFTLEGNEVKREGNTR